MKRLSIITITLVVTGLLNSCDSGTKTAVSIPRAKDSLVKRGAYLVAIMGCNDCHSPKHRGPDGLGIDTLTMLSGFPAKGSVPGGDPKKIRPGQVVFNSDFTAVSGSWGTAFAANITSDSTGIGSYDYAQFNRAFTKNSYRGVTNQQRILAIPGDDFSKVSDADVNAIFEYLKTTKPVKNVPPDFKSSTPTK